MREPCFIPNPLRSTQRASYCWSFTPAQPDRPAASVRGFCSGAYKCLGAVIIVRMQPAHHALGTAARTFGHFSGTAALGDLMQGEETLARARMGGRDNEYWPTCADEFWPTPGVFDLLSRASARLSRSASFLAPSVHDLVALRCAEVRRKR